LTGGATTYTPPVDLTTGVHFWRLYGRIGTSTGTVASPVWEFVVPSANATGVSTAWGAMADWNGDGFPDAAAGSKVSRAYVHPGKGGMTNSINTRPASTRNGPGTSGK